MGTRKSRSHPKTYSMQCCCCDVVLKVEETSLARARLWACAIGWGLTSMGSKSAKFICTKCFPKHPCYAPGEPFKQSAFTDIARIAMKPSQSRMNRARVKEIVWGKTRISASD